LQRSNFWPRPRHPDGDYCASGPHSIRPRDFNLISNPMFTDVFPLIHNVLRSLRHIDFASDVSNLLVLNTCVRTSNTQKRKYRLYTSTGKFGIYKQILDFASWFCRFIIRKFACWLNTNKNVMMLFIIYTVRTYIILYSHTVIHIPTVL